MTKLSGPLLSLLFLGGCLTNTPDPAAGGIYACVEDSDCPGTQACLQQTCEAVALPVLEIFSPEDEKPYTFTNDGVDHPEVLSVNATDMVLRPLSESSEAVPGEGHLVVFIDEAEIGIIDSGDLGAGVQIEFGVPDVPGVHRIRVQARLNDGTDYDNEGGAARNLVWVDDGNEHVALRSPWPGQVFSLEAQTIDAEVAAFGIEIGSPDDELEHVHIYYGKSFPACLDKDIDPLCEAAYSGVVSNDDSFDPVILPDASAGMVTITALVAEFDHTSYVDDEGNPVFSEIQVLRSNAGL